jgi:hypothetical protein
MTIAAIQAKADTFNPSGLPWEQVSAVMLRYRSQYEWRTERSEALEADFREAYAETEAITAELTRRGATRLWRALRSFGVHALAWRSEGYASRAEMGRSASQWRQGTLFFFTLGSSSAGEPIAPAAREAIGLIQEFKGWVLYVPEEGR